MTEKEEGWDWDPIGDEYYYGQISEGRIGAAVDGLAPEYVIPEKDILCKNPYKPGEKCYKQFCPKSHPENKAKSFHSVTEQKIAREAIAHRRQFELKSSLEKLSTCSVKIQHIGNPWDFFCNPIKSEKLLCTCECSVEEDVGDYNMEDQLRKKLTEHSKYSSKRSPHYEKQEVVSVKRVAGKETYYLRGILWEDLVVDTMEKIPDCKAKVFFMDTGEIQFVTLLDIVPLGPEWTQCAAPLAFHCSLAGIYPKGKIWSSDETEHFRSVVENKNLILKVVNTVYPPTLCFYPEKPYDVDLFICDDETNKYISVAKLMEKNSQGIMRPETPFFA